MATTTNYNWSTPDDTSLVKDGAAAIRTLGSSIDTTTKALNPSTTLGDIEYRSSTANTNTRLGIGTSGQVLAVSGGVPAWTTPATSTSGLTKITGGTYSGVSSFNLEGIFTSTYKKYVLYLTAQPSINGSSIQSQFLYSTNTVQNTDYYGSGSRLLRDNTSSNYGFVTTAQATIADSTGDSSTPSWQLTFMNVGNSSQKPNYFGHGFNTASQSYDRFTCYNDVARTYTGFKVAVSAGTITGDYVVFGVQN